MERILEKAFEGLGPREQQFLACEKMASAITEYAITDVNGKRIKDSEVITGKLNRFLPVIDALFDQVSYLPQGNLAEVSSLVRLGLQTGHLVTENSMKGWYTEGPSGEPTQVYLYYTAPEELTYQMPDYLKEKRNEIRQSLNLDEQATAGSRRH